ncbi:retrovirus-related pol polyprotein from transposon TNT 1-94 [Tanacetum coccineum]
MDSGVSWKAKLSTLHDENVLLNIKLSLLLKNEKILNLNFKSFLTQSKQHGLSIKMKGKLKTIDKWKHVNTKFHKSKILGQILCETPFNKNLAIKAKNVSNTKVTSDRSKPVTSQSTPIIEQKQQHNANVIARGMYKINQEYTKTKDSKANTNVFDSTGVGSSNSVRKSKSKDNKSKNNVLKNTKSSSTYVLKTTNSVCLDSNKCEKTPSNVCQTNACITSSKTINAINDGLNMLFISCGLDVFLHSHEKCVARSALTRKSSVKRALFTSPIAEKSKGLKATSIVVKSRFSVAKTPTATNKNLEGDDLLTGSQDLNLYTISISEMAASSPICLMSRATSTKSCLWHRRLSHLNFGTINQLTSHDLVDGLPKFMYYKNHLCSACEQGKSKKASLPPKLVPSTESKLELLHMDLCGPMRVASINGKKYILAIVDDYSRNLKASILTIRTDNGTKFKNEKLRVFYAKLGIVHKTSIARTPKKNGVVERRNRTLIEAARTMLIFSKAPEFLWAEAPAFLTWADRPLLLLALLRNQLYCTQSEA